MTRPPSRSRTSSSGMRRQAGPALHDAVAADPEVGRGHRRRVQRGHGRVAQEHGDDSILDGTLVKVVGQGRIVRREIEGRARHPDGGADVLEAAPRHHRERGLAVLHEAVARRPGAARRGRPRPPAPRRRRHAAPLRAWRPGSRRRGRRRTRLPTRAPPAAPCASCGDGPRRCCPRSSPRRRGRRRRPPGRRRRGDARLAPARRACAARAG